MNAVGQRIQDAGDMLKQTWGMVIAILVLIIVFNISTLILMTKQIIYAVSGQQPPPENTSGYRRMNKRH